MIGTLAGAISIAAAMAARPPAREQPLTVQHYASVAEAMEVALASQPALVAFGELHQTRTTARTPSALSRFSSRLLPRLAPRLSHLVVETWITTGKCGEVERAVTDDVGETTERPVTTAGEIETLLRSAAALGVAPRILSLGCADYQSMRPAGGGAVDYDRTLRVTEQALETAALGALRQNRERQREPQTSLVGSSVGGGGSPPTWGGRGAVAIYGGALHNDVYPQAGLEGYSFAPRLMAATLGRYVEIDLIVPEYAAGNQMLRSQDWWAPWSRTTKQTTKQTTKMVRRSSRSFVIIFPSPAESH